MEQQELQLEQTVLSRNRRIIFIIILGALSAFGPLCMDMYLPALPSLADDFNTSTSLAQMSITACLLGLAAGQLVVGPYSDMHGRKKPIIVALLSFTVASILCVYAPNIWFFLGFRFIQGVAGAVGIVVSKACARDLFAGTELTKFFAMMMLVNGLAPILAPVLGGQLLTFFPWRGIFGFLAIFGVIMFILVTLGLKETLPDSRKQTGGAKEVLKTFGTLMKDKTFVGYALISGFAMGGMFAYISGSSFVLQNIYGLSPQMFSFVFALNGIGLVIATQVVGKLSGTIPDKKLLLYGVLQSFISGILLLIVILLNTSVIFVCIALFLNVSCVTGINTTVFSLAMEKQGNNAGSASAFLGLLPFLFGAIISPLVGIGDGTTAVPMGIIILCCGILSLTTYITVIHKETK